MDKNSGEIIDKLDSIKKELDYIKENMVEKDQIMSSEELEAYQRSFNEVNLVSLEDSKKLIGL